MQNSHSIGGGRGEEGGTRREGGGRGNTKENEFSWYFIKREITENTLAVRLAKGMASINTSNNLIKLII